MRCVGFSRQICAYCLQLEGFCVLCTSSTVSFLFIEPLALLFCAQTAALCVDAVVAAGACVHRCANRDTLILVI